MATKKQTRKSTTAKKAHKKRSAVMAKTSSKSKKKVTKSSKKNIGRSFSKLKLALFALVFGSIGVFLLQGSFAAGRDPWVRPFRSDSIWNTPIGSNARYVDAGFPFTPRSQLDKTYFLKLKGSDPLRDYVVTGGWRDRCSGTQKTGIQLNLPNGYTIPDASQNANGSWHTPNNGWEFLYPDGKTVLTSGGGARCSGTGPIYGHGGKTTYSIYGDGILGGHGGSGLTRLGGAIRGDDLTGNEPIRHVLDLVLYSKYFYSDNKTTKTSTYRWPASKSDGYALDKNKTDRYVGNNPETRMGSLLALKPSIKPADLNIRSKEGLKIFYAMQDWGGYITDDSAWDANTLTIDTDTAGKFNWSSQQREEFGRIIDAASVVANNGPNSIGGGGTPRAALHPPLSGESSQTPSPSPAPSPSPQPQPEPNPTDTSGGSYIKPANNLTTGVAVRASSVASGTFAATKAIDGNETDNNSRWISGKSDNEWIEIDLGRVEKVDKIAILFAGNTTKTYSVRLSKTAEGFTQKASGSTDNKDFSFKEHGLSNTEARYIRIYGLSRWNNNYGHSIREIALYTYAVDPTQDSNSTDQGGTTNPAKEQPNPNKDQGGEYKPIDSSSTIGSDKGSGSVVVVEDSKTKEKKVVLSGKVSVRSDDSENRPKIVRKVLKLNGKTLRETTDPNADISLDTSTFDDGEYELQIEEEFEDGSADITTESVVIDNDLNSIETLRNKLLSPLAGQINGRAMNIILAGSTAIVSSAVVGGLALVYRKVV